MSIWDDKTNFERAKVLHQDGLSFSKIAEQIFGNTSFRNAVIGKFHRAGISRDTKGLADQPATPTAPKQRRDGLGPMRFRSKKKEPTKPRPPTIIDPGAEEREVVTEADHIHVIDLTEKMCKWPIGEPGTENFRFCGKAITQAPYCPAHAARAFVAPPPRKNLNEPSQHYGQRA